MKKVIIVLMALVLAAGFAFADADVTLKSTVETIPPAFKIEYRGSTGTDAAKTGLVTLDSGIDEGKVVAKFDVSQYGQKNSGNQVVGFSRYGSKTGTAVSLKVKVYPFINSADSTIKSAKPTVTAAYSAIQTTQGKDNTNRFTLPETDPTAVTTETAYNEITLTPSYLGKKVYDQTIGVITAEWAAEDDIPLGTYTADIVLVVTGN